MKFSRNYIESRIDDSPLDDLTKLTLKNMLAARKIEEEELREGEVNGLIATSVLNQVEISQTNRKLNDLGEKVDKNHSDMMSLFKLSNEEHSAFRRSQTVTSRAIVGLFILIVVVIFSLLVSSRQSIVNYGDMTDSGKVETHSDLDLGLTIPSN